MSIRSRRDFLGCACSATLGLAAATTPILPAFAAGLDPVLTPDEALSALEAGNASFLAGEAVAPEVTDAARRLALARGQNPFAVLIACSDSRVAPELLFGRGLGELFIIRNAGNTVDRVALGSVQYAVLELGVPLVVVLGHERCGAVKAALSVVEDNAGFPGDIGNMVEPIIPAVLHVRDAEGDMLDNAVRANVSRTVTRLRDTEALFTEPLRQGRLRIVGARYDLDDGRVDFFDRG